MSARIAAVLASCGVASGDRVLVKVDKSVEAIALYVACLRIGAVFVPFNTAYTPHEMDYFIRDSEPRLIIVRPEDRVAVDALVPNGGARVETLGVSGDGTLLTQVSAGAAVGADHFASDQLAALLYTSGTTGKPKAAMLTRGNLASNAATLVDLWRFTQDDVLLHALPIFHIHGLFVAINTVLASAAAMIFLPKLDVDEVLRLLPRATVMMGVPTYYTRLLADPRLSRDSTGHMRLFVSGSAPLPAEIIEEFEQRTGHSILERYGMTETSMIASNRYEAPNAGGGRRRAAGGRSPDHRPASGSVLESPRAVGMIEVRGPNVFRGYWRNPGEDRRGVPADGYFRTGDVGGSTSTAMSTSWGAPRT